MLLEERFLRRQGVWTGFRLSCSDMFHNQHAEQHLLSVLSASRIDNASNLPAQQGCMVYLTGAQSYNRTEKWLLIWDLITVLEVPIVIGLQHHWYLSDYILTHLVWICSLSITLRQYSELLYDRRAMNPSTVMPAQMATQGNNFVVVGAQ